LTVPRKKKGVAEDPSIADQKKARRKER